jgi:uncharacterized protein
MPHQTVFEGPVLDGHCHLGSIRYIPKDFLEDVAQTMHVKLAAYGPALSTKAILGTLTRQVQDHDAGELVREMDRANIQQTVLLTPHFGYVMDCAVDQETMVREHAALKVAHPGRFFVFGGVDPRDGVEGAHAFERWVQSGWVDGLKLYPPCGYSPSDHGLFPYYEVCARHGIPVLTHVGPTASRLDFNLGRPTLIAEASRAFPSVSFILAHGGVTYREECVELCRYRENVFLDFAGFSGAVLLDGDWETSLRNLFRLGVNEKVIFGTDWPIFKLSEGLEGLLSRLRRVVGESLSPREAEAVMGGNMRRLLARRNALARLASG